MQAFLIESSIRAALVALAVALVLWMMRIKSAATRHAVWAGVVVLMMLLPVWVARGPKAPLPVLPPQRTSAIEIVPAPLAVGLAGNSSSNSSVSSSPVRENGGYPVIPAIYLLGVGVLLLRLTIGTVRASRLQEQECVAPVTVGILRPRILLPGSAQHWPQAQLDAVLAHEREHARRRDPLFQWLALLNRAIFWFHPLAWWLERKLAGLAEEACDAAVLAHGYDPREYSEYLLGMARSVRRAGTRIEAVGMAMPGVYLPQRIRRMLSGVPVPRVSPRRMAWTAGICSIAAVVLVAGTLVHAQSRKMEFEVASIRPAKRNAGGSGGAKSKGGGGGVIQGLQHGRLTLSSDAFGLVLRAYNIRGCGPAGFRPCALVTGGPDWIKNDRFDLQAKTPDGTPDYTMGQLFDGRAPEISLMLQTLLAERFNLKFHRETRDLPVYALTVVKRSAKIEPTKGETIQAKDGTTSVNRSMLWTFPRGANGDFNQAAIQMIIRDRTIQELTDLLTGAMDRPVLNRTGLAGEFDITLQYDRDTDLDSDGLNLDGTFGPSMMKAFERELGLKFEATKGPVDILVIDHIERPSEN